MRSVTHRQIFFAHSLNVRQRDRVGDNNVPALKFCG